MERGTWQQSPGGGYITTLLFVVSPPKSKGRPNIPTPGAAKQSALTVTPPCSSQPQSNNTASYPPRHGNTAYKPILISHPAAFECCHMSQSPVLTTSMPVDWMKILLSRVPHLTGTVFHFSPHQPSNHFEANAATKFSGFPSASFDQRWCGDTQCR